MMTKLTVQQNLALKIFIEGMSDEQLVAFYDANKEIFDLADFLGEATEAFNRLQAAEEIISEAEAALVKIEADEATQAVTQTAAQEVKTETDHVVVQPQVVQEVVQSASVQEVLVQVSHETQQHTEEQTRKKSVEILRRYRYSAAARALEMNLDEGASVQRLEQVRKDLKEAIDSKTFDKFVLRVMKETFQRVGELLETAEEDNGEFEKEHAAIEKEDRRQKAVTILRKENFENAADVILEIKNPKDFMDELIEVGTSKIPHGIKDEWICPLVRPVAAAALEEWSEAILAATIVLNPGFNSNQDFMKVVNSLKTARSLDLYPYLWVIEKMVLSYQYPKNTISLLHKYPELAEAASRAQRDGEKNRKASAFLNNIVGVIEEALQPFSWKPKEQPGTAGVTKTQMRKEARPNADAERRARQLERAAVCQSMVGRNPSVDKFGKGKKSKRTAS